MAIPVVALCAAQVVLSDEVPQGTDMVLHLPRKRQRFAHKTRTTLTQRAEKSLNVWDVGALVLGNRPFAWVGDEASAARTAAEGRRSGGVDYVSIPSCRAGGHYPVTKGWAERWRDNGWKRNAKEEAVNADLWERLLILCEKHEVEFVWIQGHAGHPENERCDLLSVAAARTEGLPADIGYEERQAKREARETVQRSLFEE